MCPLSGISARYSLFIASILLAAIGLVLAIAGYFVFEGTNDLRTDLNASFSSAHDRHDIETLRQSSNYLGNRLFDPLYDLDVTRLNEEIGRIQSWLSPDSVLILDRNGRVVTDGSVENPDYGRQFVIPEGLKPDEPLVENGDSGLLAYFSIGHGATSYGYARILLSHAADRALLEALHAQVGRAWQRFVDRFLAIAWVSVLATFVVSLMIGMRLSASLSRPLRDMNRVVEQYAAGNLEHKLPESSRDELGSLARSLNQMASQHERARNQLMLLANYDNLTRLPNRHLFYDRLRQAIVKAKRSHHRVALFFLDLDRFKEINDALGHDVGDELLTSVTGRLGGVVREGDTLARMGGDEFTLIVEGESDDRVLQGIAKKLLEALRSPMQLGDRTLYVSASIGIATYPDQADRPETLIKYADTAMYAAKEQGRGGYRFFTQELQEIASERLALEHALRRAVELKEFVLHYQPLVQARDGVLQGIEVLLRWCDGDRVRSPTDFIGLLEETRLITQLTHWVLRQAMAALMRVQDSGFPELRLCVNLSAHQFQQRSLPTMIDSVLLEFGVRPDRLELEITESTLLDEGPCQINANKLAERGVRLAIDDFGTGYSSLTYLRRFHVDVIKIDRSFVSSMLEDLGDGQIVAAVLALASGLGIETVAEGVERPAQRERLVELGCDLVQGYLISPPLGIQGLIDWLTTDRDPEDFPPDTQERPACAS